MTKTRSTKSALISAILALAMTLSCFVGTTFAWFTDSVTSANNIIQSGNLDIELEYWNNSEWKTVDGASDILTNTLWEPGATEVAYLRVANAGSLALKYQLGINIVSELAGVNKAGDSFNLSDYIMFGVVEGVNGETAPYTSREAAVAAVADADKISAGFSKASSMAKDEELYLALVVYMPDSVGNVANHNGINIPEIDLGITVLATQYTAENDSFDEFYDEDASYPVVSTKTVENTGDSVELSNSILKLTIPGSATAEGDFYEMVVSNEVIETNTATGETTVDFDLTLYKNNEKADSNEVYEIAIPVGNVYITNVSHNGVALAEATTGADQTYKYANGVLYIYTKSFSPFSLSYLSGDLIATNGDEVYKMNFDEFRASVNGGNDFSGWTVILQKDIDFNGAEFAPIGIATGAGLSIEGCAPFSGMFDGNGYTLSNYKITDGITVDGDPWLSLFALIYAKDGNTAGVKNLTIDKAAYNNVNGTVGVIANLANSDGESAIEFSNLNINASVNAFGYYGEAGLVTLMYGSEATVENVDIDVDFVIPADFTVSGYKFISPCFGQLSMLQDGHITLTNVDYSDCGFYYPTTFKLEDRSTVIAGYNSIWVYDTPAGTRVLSCGGYAGQFYDRNITVTIDGTDYTHAELKKDQKDAPGYMYDYIIRPDAFTAYTPVTTAAELKAALKDDAVIMITKDISDASIKLPSALKNVTVKAAAGVSLINTTITSADGNSLAYDGLTFDGIIFDNSNIVLTGMRSGSVIYKDLTVKNCVFKNIERTGNYAAIHMNMATKEAVQNFTFTNNIVDGVNGSSNNALTLKYVTGNITISDNSFKNVALYPFNLMIANADAIDDNVAIKNNVFADSANGRLQGVGSNTDGTDNVAIEINNNIISGITNTYQICFWQFNDAKTTADLSENYFDADIANDPGNIYFNKKATSIQDLANMGIFPYYTELNANGTINTDSLVELQ